MITLLFDHSKDLSRGRLFGFFFLKKHTRTRTLSVSLSEHGFTLIEFLVIATVVGILSSFALVSFQRTARISRDNRREKDMQILRVAMESYYETYHDYPVAATFAVLMANANFMQFVQASTIQDPVNSGSYVYTANSTLSDYQLCYQQENASGIRCITNP